MRGKEKLSTQIAVSGHTDKERVKHPYHAVGGSQGKERRSDTQDNLDNLKS